MFKLGPWEPHHHSVMITSVILSTLVVVVVIILSKLSISITKRSFAVDANVDQIRRERYRYRGRGSSFGTVASPFDRNSVNLRMFRPPLMGWRSWNLFDVDITQTKIEDIMRGMVMKRKMSLRSPNSSSSSSTDHSWIVHTFDVSLYDLGYRDVGLDDGWQNCHSKEAAKVGMHYHDKDGIPAVNLERFPSLKELTTYGHSLNLTVSWYANNCMCNDQCRNDTECKMQINGDVDALFRNGFDGVKIDACGNETSVGLGYWYDTIQQQGGERRRRIVTKDDPIQQDIVIENCHQSDPNFKPDRTLEPPYDCPYDYYRTSRDIRNNYGSVMSNLQTVFPFHGRNESWPGCWAYPDMLMVGVPKSPTPTNSTTTGNINDLDSNVGLTLQETRSHFASWAIISSPLILSHDVSSKVMGEVLDPVWDIITNSWTIRINQAYFGDSGGPFFRSRRTNRFHVEGKFYDEIPSIQYLYKPISMNTIAILLMNSNNKTETLSTKFQYIPYNDCGERNRRTPELKGSQLCSYHVYDVWSHLYMGKQYDNISALVEPHDAAFFLLRSPMSTSSDNDHVRASSIWTEPRL